MFDIPTFTTSDEYKIWLERLIGRSIHIEPKQAPTGETSPGYTDVKDPDKPRVIIHNNIVASDAHRTQVLIHEFMHIYLLYVHSFPHLRYINTVTLEQDEICSMGVTLVSDGAVNRITQEIGFPADLDDYMQVLKTGIAFLNKKRLEAWKESHLMEKKVVYNFVYCSIVQRTLNLTEEGMAVCNKFQTIFGKAVPESVRRQAGTIFELIKHNDITTAAGSRIITERVMELWGMSSLVSIGPLILSKSLENS